MPTSAGTPPSALKERRKTPADGAVRYDMNPKEQDDDGGRVSLSEGPSYEKVPQEVRSVLVLLAQFVAVGVFGVGAIYLKYIIEPPRRGFFCGDLSIRRPYLNSTVPLWLIPVVGNGLILASVAFVEYASKTHPRVAYQLRGRILNAKMILFSQFILLSLLGSAINIFLLNIIKGATGQLRPHFLDVCVPSVDVTQCSRYEYIQNYTCTAAITRKLVDARLSFFSGHTSSSFYYATFLSIYIHERVARRHKSWMPLFMIIHSVLFTSASWVGVTRILDHKHHASDVIAGGLLGTLLAFILMYAHKHLFEGEPARVESPGRERRVKFVRQSHSQESSV